jgi:hypothetical protein
VVVVSDFNYTKCAKPFASHREARDFMVTKDFEGSILAREDGTYTAVCPTYPEGYYPDAVTVEVIDKSALKKIASISGNCC